MDDSFIPYESWFDPFYEQSMSEIMLDRKQNIMETSIIGDQGFRKQKFGPTDEDRARQEYRQLNEEEVKNIMENMRK